MSRWRELTVITALLLVLLTVTTAHASFLTFLEVRRDGIGGVDGLDGAVAIAISPDGNHVYAAGLDEDAIAVFSRNATTGALTFVEVQKDGVGGVDGLDGVVAIAISPDGNHLYATGVLEDSVAVFSRNSTTGDLTFVEREKDGLDGVDGLDGADAVKVSPDGMHVYIAGYFDNAVAVFGRDSTTGALTFVEVQKDAPGGVSGISQAYDVTVSSDNNNVYVVGYADDAVAVFSRNTTSGALTYLESHSNGSVGGVNGLDGAYSVTVSPDGQHLYATGYLDDAIAVFSRNPATGRLTFVGTHKDGVGGIDGLDGADTVVVGPDNQFVYVTGFLDDAIEVFSRNPSTGILTRVEMQRDGINGVDGVDGAREVIVSPDNKHVYATGQVDDAVAVFSVPVFQFRVFLPVVLK